MVKIKSKDIGVRGVLTPLLVTGLTLIVGPIFEFVPDMMWHDRQRIGQVVLLIIMVLGGVSVWRHALWDTLNRLPKYARVALFFGFFIGAVSAVFSKYPRYAWLEWSTFLLLIATMLLIASHARCKGKVFDQWAIRVVWIIALLILLRIMMGYLAALIEKIELDTISLFTSSFSNRRVFGQVASMVIPLLAYPLLRTKTPLWQRWAFFLLLAAWWMLVIVSATRGTALAIAGSSILLAIFLWQSSRPWLKWQMAGLLAGAILFIFLFMWIPTWLGQTPVLENRASNLTTLSGREELWSMAWAVIQAQSWLGIGPMHFASLGARFGAHPHNAVLQLASEWGVIATAAFMLPVVVVAKRLVMHLRQSSVADPLLICLTASLLAASIQSMVDGVIVIPYTQIWLIFIAGWILGIYIRKQPELPLHVHSRFGQAGIVFFGSVAITLLLYGIYPEIFNRVIITETYIEKALQTDKPMILPRYWGAGEIP